MKYTEEEKKALEDLKECENCHYRDRENCMCEINYDYKKTILNIIEKQQKEIEKQASLIKFDVKYRNQLEQDLYENASNYVISKEKIKNKIKELENIEIDYDNLILQGDKILFAIRILEELIGIEPRKEFWKGYKQ